MAQLKSETFFGSILILIVTCLIVQGSNRITHDKCIVYKGFDYDTTFCIVAPSVKKLIYYGGHNRIKLDTIIENNYVFIETIYTEECSDWIIIYNPEKDRLMRAYNLVWCYELDDYDWDLLRKGVPKVFSIEAINETDSIVRIKFFNDKIRDLELTPVMEY